MRWMQSITTLLATTLSLGVVTGIAIAAAQDRSPRPAAASLKPTPRPAPATSVSKHPAIVHIVSRHGTLTISSGPTGLLYSLAGEHGKVLVADASGPEFERLHPELYRSIRHYIAVQSDAGSVMSASALRSSPPDAGDADVTASADIRDAMPVGIPLADLDASR